MFVARLSGTGSNESEKVDIQALVRLERILAAARRREAKITVYVFYWLNTCFYGVFDRSRGRLKAGCARARAGGGRRTRLRRAPLVTLGAAGAARATPAVPL